MANIILEYTYLGLIDRYFNAAGFLSINLDKLENKEEIFLYKIKEKLKDYGYIIQNGPKDWCVHSNNITEVRAAKHRVIYAIETTIGEII